MRRKETQSLAEVLRQLISEQHLDRKIAETRLLNAVDETLGPNITAFVSRKKIYGTTLCLSVTSSIVRNELLMMRRRLVETLNQRLGENLLTDIRVD